MPHLCINSVNALLLPCYRLVVVLTLLVGAGCSPSTSDPTGGGNEARTPGEATLHRAINALDEGRADQARIALDAYVEQHPDDVGARRLAGDAWMAGTLRSPSRAIEHWRLYLKQRPGDFDLAVRLAESLYLLGEWQEAEAWCERLDEGPRAQRLRARVFLDSDPVRAEGAIRKALEALSGGGTAAAETADTHALAARITSELGESERAADHAEQAIALDPFDLQSTYLLARTRRRLGDGGRADALLETHQLLAKLTGAGSQAPPSAGEALSLVRDLAPKVDAGATLFRLELLRQLVENGERDEALPLLAELSGEAGLEPASQLELVGLADRLGALDIARALLGEVLAESEPVAEPPPGDSRAANHREAIFGLALLDHREGDLEGARRWVEAGLERYPHTARLHHLAGRLAIARSENSTTEEHYATALELAPWKIDCRLDLANLWLAEGKLEAVTTLLEAAPEAHPALDAYRRRHGLL